MKKNEYIIVFLSFLVIIMVLVGVITFLAFKSPAPSGNVLGESCEEDIFNKGLVDIITKDWDIVGENYDTFFFFYAIQNYGSQTAKDIKVRCKIINMENSIPLFSGLQEIGDLKAGTSEFVDLTVPLDPRFDVDGRYSTVCYVESCNNCEILYKRIPAIVETFEVE